MSFTPGQPLTKGVTTICANCVLGGKADAVKDGNECGAVKEVPEPGNPIEMLSFVQE